MKTRKLIFSGVLTALLLIALSLPVAGSIEPTELSAVLMAGESVSEVKTVFVPPVPPAADVVFSFDLTGSMLGIIDTAKAHALDIMAQLNAIPGVNIHFGVMSYMDYPYYYESCGYADHYGDIGYGDYAYALNQSITDDTAAVNGAIASLNNGYGADGPQDYTRVFYESYADTNVSWRTGAKHILVNFGDNVPHDCNLNESVHDDWGIWSTGCDPGRDEIAGTGDDLDLQTVLAEMATNGVTLVESHTTEYASEYWNYWTGITGGQTLITTSSTLVEDVVAAVQATLEAPIVKGLHLEASSGYESWLTSVDPATQDVTPEDSGAFAEFDMTLTVPTGTASGIYTFTVSALDQLGVNYGDQNVMIVVYDPGAGFVTGGGWIYSQPGAYKADSLVEGKAKFGFVSKYLKGVTKPTGNTEFQFQAAGLNFHSSSYEWLVVTGSNYAKFKGTGTINGEGVYKFILWAGDNNPDTFRIKIWSEDGSGGESVIYDNGFDQAIGSGSIVIHK